MFDSGAGLNVSSRAYHEAVMKKNPHLITGIHRFEDSNTRPLVLVVSHWMVMHPRLTHSHKGVEYKRVQESTAWVSYLDRQQEQTSTVDDESGKMEIQKWMENEKYTRDQLIYVVRSQYWRQNKSFKLPKNNNCIYKKTEEHSAISHPKLSHILITSRN
jgi:hypothetical protein